MDPDAFRDAVKKLESSACPFAPSILAGCAACPLAHRARVAEGERVICPSPGNRDRCTALREALQKHSAFALGVREPDTPLPHAKILRMLCGGLEGLATVLGASTRDIRGLADSAHRHGIGDLPWPEVMRAVSGFSARRRR